MASPVLTPTWLILKQLVEDLVQERGELVELVMAEKAARIETYASSSEKTDAGRKREADYASLPYWRDRVKMETSIQQKEDLRLFLTLAIEHGVEVAD